MTETPTGIFLPQGHMDNSLRRGTIVAVGPGKLYPDGERIPLSVHVGERVVFTRMAGVEIKYEEGSYLVMREQHILAVIGE